MGGKGPSPGTTQQEQAISQQQLNIAQSQEDRAQQQYEFALPYQQTVANHYSKLASGDPQSIQLAEGPAIQGITQAGKQTQDNIRATSPRGGVEQLAEEENKINTGAQVGQVKANAYNQAFPALAAVAQGGFALSAQEISSALQGFSGAENTTSNLANQQAEGKAASLGFYSSLAGTAAEGAAACWVAERLYGYDSFRTRLFRWWLNNRYAETTIGKRVMDFYIKYGKQVAAFIGESPVRGLPFRFLFWLAYRPAVREYDRMFGQMLRSA